MKRAIIYLKTTILLTLILGSPTIVKASPGGIAGPDSTICPGESVTIGAGTKSGCYAWFEGSKLIGNSARISVSPNKTTYYTVIYTAPNFTSQESDGVTVYVSDIAGISASPKLCCYKSGDGFKKEDFNITTSPPNFKNVTFSFDPSSAPKLLSILGGGVQDKSITVKAKGCQKEVETQTTVTVVDKDIVESYQFEQDWGKGPAYFARNIKHLMMFNKLLDVFSYYCQISPVTGFKYDKFKLAYYGGFKLGNVCCADNGTIYSGPVSVNGGVKAKGGLTFQGPLPFPALAPYLYWFVSVSVGGDLGVTANFSSCDDLCVCLALNGFVNPKIGIETNPHPTIKKLIDAKGYVDINFTSPLISGCLGKDCPKKKDGIWITWEVNLAAEVNFICLGAMKFKYTLYKDKFPVNLD